MNQGSGGLASAGSSAGGLLPGTELVAATSQTSVSLDGQVVILGIDSGKYYRLDEVGARIWELLREPRSLASIVEAIVAEYEVEREQAFGDARELVQELMKEGLVVTRTPAA